MKGIICSLLILTVFISQGFSQCHLVDNFYNRSKPSDYYIYDIKAIKDVGNENFSIEIDTIIEDKSSSGYFLQNKSFKLFNVKDERHKRVNAFIKDFNTDSIYPMGETCDDLTELNEQNENYIFLKKLRTPTIFYFKTKRKISLGFNENKSKEVGFHFQSMYKLPMDFSNFSITGINDTAIFFLSKEPVVKLNDKKHYYQTLMELGPSGLKIVSEGPSNFDLSNNIHYYDGINYYDGIYKVETFFVKDFEESCTFYSVYKEKVFYNNNLIDSFNSRDEGSYVKGYRAKPDVETLKKNDTLCVFNGVEYYRYYKAQKALNVNVDSIYNSNYFPRRSFYKVLNDYAVFEASQYDSLFLVFNIYTRKFLGYPKIIFTKKN